MKKLILLALLLPIAAFAQTGQGSGNVTIQFAVIPASCVVTPVAPTIPPNLPSGSTQSFTFTFTQNGGCLGTTSWSMVPTTAAGLTMSTTGVLSGTVATCTTGNCNTSAVISVTFAGVILPKTGERVGAGHSELQMGVPTKPEAALTFQGTNRGTIAVYNLPKPWTSDLPWLLADGNQKCLECPNNCCKP